LNEQTSLYYNIPLSVVVNIPILQITMNNIETLFYQQGVANLKW